MYGVKRFCPHLNASGVGTQLIVTNGIVARHIQKYQVSASHLVTGVIGATLTQNKVTAWHIGTDVIGSRHMGSDAVTGNHIAAAAIVASHVGVGAITKAKLGALAVSTLKIGTNMIDGRVLAADSVQTSHLGTNAVNGVILAAAGVTNGHVKGTSLGLGEGTHLTGWGKLNGIVVSFGFATHGVTVAVDHGLARAVYGWQVIRNNGVGYVYEADNVATQLGLVGEGAAMTNAAVKVVVW